MKKLLCILVVLVLAFSLVACNKTPSENTGNPAVSNSPGTTGSSKPVEITVALSVLPNSLDPIGEDFPDTMAVCYLIYDRLVNFDEAYNMLPGIAKSWSQVDSTTWTFDIGLDDYVFQNGDKLTMDDIVYSINRLKDIPKSADTGAQIGSVTYDGTTLTLKFTKEDNTLLPRILTTAVIVDKAYVEAGGDDAVYMHPIGTGPYKVVDFTPGTATAVQTWDGYLLQKPQIDKITFTGIADTSGRYIAVETGQAQFTGQLTPFEMNLAKDNDNIVTVSKDTCTTTGFIFNCERPPFDNVDVRTAVTYAVDRASIAALQGGRTPMTSFLFGGYSDWYIESADMPGFDLDKAKSMLEAAGYNASNPLKIALTTYQTDEPGLELFQSTLKSIGVEVDPNIVEFGVYLATEQSGDFDMLLTSFLNHGGTPLTDLERVDPTLFGTRDIARYSNDQVTDIINTMRTSTDTQQLKDLSVQLNDILAQDLPMVALFQFTLYCAMDKNLTGVSIAVDGMTNFRTAVYTG